MIDFTIPNLELVNATNEHCHWRKRQARAKAQRGGARISTAVRVSVALRDASHWLHGPLLVTITRIGPRRLDDDGATASAKPIRDGIADALGIDDRDPRVTWRVEQARGGVREYGVRVTIEQRSTCPHCGAARGAA
jgi:hypothetical protein